MGLHGRLWTVVVVDVVQDGGGGGGGRGLALGT